jgi:hypothetical protein
MWRAANLLAQAKQNSLKTLSCALVARISPYDPAERYILFEFEVESVVMTEYKNDQAVCTHLKIEE